MSKPYITRSTSINWILLFYFLTGTCSVIDEVVWVRLLKLTIGNTVYATSIVVSVFLGGLAVGSLIMSKFADHVSRPLRLYALLETLASISALLLPFTLKFADNEYVWFYRIYHPTNSQLLIVQVIISSLILLIPTMVMGSTFPLLGRFITSLEKETGHLVGKLYALNTFGAAVGCFLAGFVFIRSFGVMGTLYTAAGLNLLVAFGGWFLSHFTSDSNNEQTESTLIVPAFKVAKEEKVNSKFYVLILAFFMSGLISVGYELLWMRSIVHLLRGSTYVFSAVLTIYLLGNVIGVAIGSKLAEKLKEPAVGFAISLSVLGIFGILYLPLLIWWSSKVLIFFNNLVIYLKFPAAFYTIGPLVQSTFLFLLPSIIMGIGFPLALQAWANHMHKVGKSTGTAYGANTIGAVIGGIVTGFVLIPLLGLERSISLLGLSGIWIGCIVYIIFTTYNLKYFGFRLGFIKQLVVAGLVIILTTALIIKPLRLFNTLVEMNEKHPEQFILLGVEEGITTTASVHRNLEDDSLRLWLPAGAVAGDAYFLRGDQKMLGHFGVLLNRNAKKVLSVGFGTGESTACLARHNLERIDCAETSPEVVKISRKFFRHLNLGDKLDEKVNIIYMDAKNYLYLTDKKYDVIISDVTSVRNFAENASLYTKEYFKNAKRHLNDEGLFISWMPTYAIESNAVINSIIATMMDVYPHVTIWVMTTIPEAYNQYFFIVGSEKPQYFSPKHIENELSKEAIYESLSFININNSRDVMSCYIGDEQNLKNYIKSFTVNSDYFPFIEFYTNKEFAGHLIQKEFFSKVRDTSIYNHIDWTGFTEEEKKKWIANYQKLYNASTNLLMMNTTSDFLEQLKYCMEGLNILPNNPALLDNRKRVEERILFFSINIIQSGKVDEGLSIAERILKIYPQSAIAWIIKSTAEMLAIGDMQKSLNYALKAVEHAPDNYFAHFTLGSALYAMGQFKNAIKEYETALRLTKKHSISSYQKVLLLNGIAHAYRANGQIPEAINAANEALKLALLMGHKDLAQVIKNNFSHSEKLSALEKMMKN